MEIYDMVLIFRVQLQLIFIVFLLNNLWNLWWGGKCFFIRFRNIFPMLVFTFLLYAGLNQMIFLFRCFLLLAVSIFAWYLSLCLYPGLSKASWYRVTTSLKISSEENNVESRDSIASGSGLTITRYILFNYFLFGKGDKLNFQDWVLRLHSLPSLCYHVDTSCYIG